VAGSSAARAGAAFQQALALHRQSRLEEARILCGKALRLQPRNVKALHLLGIIALQTGDPAKALECIDDALRIDPDSADSCYNRGLALQALGRHEAAIASYERVIALRADHAPAFHQRGKALHALGRYEAAISSYQEALARNPGYASTYDNLGNALYELGRYEAAIASYEHAIALDSGYADAYFDRGVALGALKRHEEAAASYERAVALIPRHAVAHNNRGAAQAELKDYAAALRSYDEAIALDASYAEAWHNRGNALYELAQHTSAAQSYERALTLRPDYAEAHYGLGVALAKLGRHEAAVQSYQRALELKPSIRFLRGMLLLSRMQICDWSSLQADRSELLQLIERGEAVCGPFALLVVCEQAAAQQRCAQILVRELFPPDHSLGPIASRPQAQRIRIGYFSADFHNHATLHLMAGLFEAHDRSAFECTAFSFGPHSQDAMRARLLASCEHFLDVRELSDRQIAALARERQIDIAVDLKGYTEGHRTAIFALRAAPLQLSYLGYPGTLGAPYIDYLIADPTVLPEHSRCHYSEKIIELPDCYQINDAQRPIAALHLQREQCALPPTGFVFCCFNNCYKITPQTFECWMRLLLRIEHSVLWLLEDNAAATRNLRREAAERGVNPERLIFAPRLPPPEHLARHALADLFLDTLPCNAHTTASDALWAGLPVLTCPGEAFAARVAASLLTALQLPELIASSPEHYETTALQLASQPRLLAQLRARLASNRLSSPLFNTTLTTRHIESAYASILQRFRLILPPEYFRIQRSA